MSNYLDSAGLEKLWAKIKAGFALNSSLANYVPTSRTITAGTGLTGGGNLSANRTLALDTAYTDSRYLPVTRYNAKLGWLIKTDVSQTKDAMMTFLISGNGYAWGNNVINTQVNLYSYNNSSILSYEAIHFGMNLGNIRAFVYDGVLCLWFPYISNFQSIQAVAHYTNVDSKHNRVVSITDSELPSDADRLVTIIPKLNAFTDSDITGNASTATKLTTSAGGSNRPVYFSDGKPIQIDYTLAAACAKGVVDASSARAIQYSGTSLITERAVYYGLPKINNEDNYTSNTSIYAPTSGGSAGQYLKSAGATSTPVFATFLKPVVTWIDGAENGKYAPTVKVKTDGGDSDAKDIPVATASKSGVVTTVLQTFAGDKHFTNNIILYNNQGIGFFKTGDTTPSLGNMVSVNTGNEFILGFSGRDTSTTKVYGKTLRFFTGGTERANIDATGVFTNFYNIQSTSGGVSAAGISELTVSGGGGQGTVQSITVGSTNFGNVDVNGTLLIGDIDIRNAMSLGSAALKNVGTVSIGSAGLVTGDQVQSAINAALTAAMKIEGVTTTEIADGDTTSTVVIKGQSMAAYKGMVVFYGTKEFLWAGTSWVELGDQSSFALKTTTVTGTGYLTGGGELAVNQTIDIKSDYKTYIDRGNTAYGWGNHASAGYATTSALNTHIGKKDNPHSVTKAQVGLGNVENTALSTWAGTTNVTTLGTVTTGTWSANTIAVTKGGTGKTSVAANSMLYASSGNTYSEVATTSFGRGLLSATSGTEVVGLRAATATTATALTSNAGSTTQPIYFSGGKPVAITGAIANSTTGNAATVSRATFGDASNGEHNCNNITSNGLWHYNSNGPSTSLGASTTDGALYSQASNTSWVAQIAQDYRNGRLFVRGKNGGAWQSWWAIPYSDANSVGSNTKPVYLSAGKITAVTYDLKSTVNTGTSGYAAYFSGATAISAVSLATSDPSASGSGITYISSISQDAKGKITAAKSTVRDAGLSQSGVVNTGTQSFKGDKTLNGAFLLYNNKSIGFYKDGDTDRFSNMLSVNTGNDFIIGYGGRDTSTTKIYGKTLALHEENTKMVEIDGVGLTCYGGVSAMGIADLSII